MRRVLFPLWGCALAACLCPLVVSGSVTAPVPPLREGVQGPLSLAEAVRLALAQNPERRVASAGVEAAAGRALQGRTLANPDLELGAEDWPLRGGGGYSSSKRTLGISQSLPFPGKRRLEKQIGVAGVNVAELDLAAQRQQLVREVSVAYFRVQAAEASVTVAGDLVRLADSSAEVARKRVAAGAAALQEQLRAELLAEQSHLLQEEQQADLVVARQSFGALLGDSRLSEAALSDPLRESCVEGLLGGDPGERISGHVSLLSAEQELERAELQLRRSRLEAYSDFKVAVAGGRAGAGDESIVQLSLSVPLPVFDRGKGRQQEARAQVAAARARREGLRLQLVEAWTVAARRYQSALVQVGKYREQLLPKAEEARRLVQQGFEQGKFGFIDLLDTQRSTAELRLAYQQKLLELNRAQVELEALSLRGGQVLMTAAAKDVSN